MIERRTPINGGEVYIDQVQSVGSVDYIQDGRVVRNADLKSVMIASQNDLANLTGYEPGTIAYTAGFKAIWQLSATGQWVAL